MMQIARVTHIYPPLTSSDLKEELYSFTYYVIAEMMSTTAFSIFLKIFYIICEKKEHVLNLCQTVNPD